MLVSHLQDFSRRQEEAPLALGLEPPQESALRSGRAELPLSPNYQATRQHRPTGFTAAVHPRGLARVASPGGAHAVFKALRTRPWLAFLLCLCWLPLLVGCKSDGPRTERWSGYLPYERTNGPVMTLPPRANGAATHLPPAAFSAVEQTNPIRPEWLQPATNSFRLGPGDGLEIEVLGEASSRANATVGPDGKIYYSLLPGVFVWGLTLAETRDLLAAQLGKIMRTKPEVAVTLRTVESQRVWILGAVQKPGDYSLAASMPLIEAVSTAGGIIQAPGSLTGVPDLRRSFLLRDGQRVQVDFHRLLAQGDLSQNLYLQPDDFVFLQSDTARNVYVLGAVPQPSIIPYSDRLSLFAAIASCGGTLPYAQGSKVAIIRGSLVDPRVALVDYGEIRKGKLADIALEQGDIVYVSFVPYRKLALLLEGALSQFVYSVGYNYGSKVGGGYPVGPTVTPAGGP